MAFGDIQSLLDAQQGNRKPPLAPVPAPGSLQSSIARVPASAPVAPRADPQHAANVQAFASGGIAALLHSMANPIAAPAIAASPPGTRSATQGSPSQVATAQVSAPGSPGSIESLGGMTGAVAPSSTDASTVAQNSLARTLAPSTGNGDSTVLRGNGGIAALARNPIAQGQFNTLQSARGNGITASTDPNGRLALTNVGVNGQPNPVTQPQSFTQGFDLAGANTRMRASLDAGYDSDRKAQIADLTTQLGSGNAPPGSPRAAALTNQIAALSQVQQSGQATAARAGLEAAQGNLANTQAAVDKDKLVTSQAAAKQLSQVQQQFIAENDPGKSKMLQDKILTLLGKDPKEGQFQIVTQDELNDPSQPLLGSHKVAAIVDQRTGIAQSLNAALSNGIGVKGTAAPVPPANHVAALKGDPKLAAQFDAVYGAGAAKKALNG